MSFIHNITLLPVVVILALTCVVLMMAVFCPKSRSIYYVAQLAVIAGIVLTFLQYEFLAKATIIASSSLIIDHLSAMSSIFILVLSLFAFLYAKKELKRMKLAHGEYYGLCLFSILGMLLMASAFNFITLYLSIELMSLPLYALCIYKRESGKSAEAAIKYFVTGALASGLMLYGLSLIFGATQTINFSQISVNLVDMSSSSNVLMLVGIAFVFAGFAFKFGLAPFHMWVPDVFEGVPSVVALFIASAPKIATFAIVVRLFFTVFNPLHAQWTHFFILIAVLSLLLGNITAIAQTNIKRLFAYSSIAHMGYMILGLIAGTKLGLSASLFYVVSYSFVTVGGFGVLALMNSQGYEIKNISDLSGLNQRNPWLAFIMLLLIFSMAGVPPTVGFVAKLGVIMSLVQQHYIALAVFAVLMAVIGLYYYLRIIKVMYFESSTKAIAIPEVPADATVAITINGLAVLLFGVFPGVLLSLCHMAFV
jgi:NADH-quinone oxidoreductase subunit N